MDLLSDFIKKPTLKRITPNNKSYTVLYDFNMFMFKSLFGVLRIVDNVHHENFKNIYVRKLIKEITYCFNKLNFNITNGYMVFDYGNWRKEISPVYKKNRPESRAESEIDFKYFFEFLNEVIKDLEKSLPFKYLKVYNCEADDIIGQYCINNPNENILLLSSDKDFKQLHLYNKNIIQYSPQNWKKITDVDFDVRVHAIIGDGVDFVLKLKKGVGIKTASKIVKQGKLDKWLEANNLTEKYELNLKLVDLNRIPQKYKDEIKENIKNAKTKFNLFSFFKFKSKYGLNIDKDIFKSIME